MKYNVIMLECDKCGNEFETDLPVDLASAYPCYRCGETKWTQKQMKRALRKDTTAPLEIKREKEEKE